MGRDETCTGKGVLLLDNIHPLNQPVLNLVDMLNVLICEQCACFVSHHLMNSDAYLFICLARDRERLDMRGDALPLICPIVSECRMSIYVASFHAIRPYHPRAQYHQNGINITGIKSLIGLSDQHFLSRHTPPRAT